MRYSIDWDIVALEFMEQYDSDRLDGNNETELDFVIRSIRMAWPTLDALFKRKVETCVRHAAIQHRDEMVGIEAFLAEVAPMLEAIDLWDLPEMPESRRAHKNKVEIDESMFQSNRKKLSAKELSAGMKWSSPHNVFKMSHRYENALGENAFDVADGKHLMVFKSVLREFCKTRNIVFWRRMDIAIKHVAKAAHGAESFKDAVGKIAEAFSKVSPEEAMEGHKGFLRSGKRDVIGLLNNVRTHGRALESAATDRHAQLGSDAEDYLMASNALATHVCESAMDGDLEPLDEFDQFLHTGVSDEERKYFDPSFQAIHSTLGRMLMRASADVKPESRGPVDDYQIGIPKMPGSDRIEPIISQDIIDNMRIGIPRMPGQDHPTAVLKNLDGIKAKLMLLEKHGVSDRYVKREPSIMDKVWDVWVSELDPNAPNYQEQLAELREEYEKRFVIGMLPKPM